MTYPKLQIEFAEDVSPPKAPDFKESEFGHQATYYPNTWKLVAGGEMLRMDYTDVGHMLAEEDQRQEREIVRVFIPMQRINSFTELH